MDPISIALGLAQFIPGLIRWISGDDQSKAAQVADQVVGVAKQVTGKSEADQALAAIKADPALALQLQQAWLAHDLALAQEESRQLAEINATMRAEVAAQDAYVRRWRPTFGYAVALTWSLTMAAVSWAIVDQPGQAPAIIAALVNTSPIWGIALTVLGVSVVKRSHDKAVAGGQTLPEGLLAGLVAGVKSKTTA
jgi:hypothetical protein